MSTLESTAARPDAAATAAGEISPLLASLHRFTALYAKSVSLETLVAGLPVPPGQAWPDLFPVDGSDDVFSRAASRAGFSSRLVHRPLAEFSDLLLPCILLLKNKGACILESVNAETGQCKVLLPEIPDGEHWLSIEELDECYLGYGYLLKKRYQPASRDDATDHHKGHWFWGTLARSKDLYVSVVLASLVVNLFVIATPLFTMNVYDRVVPNDAIETLWVLACGIAIVFILDFVLRYLRLYLLELAGKKSDVIMSSILFEQVLNLRLDSWPKSVGAFASKLRDFESIRTFFTSATLVSVVDLPFSLLFLVVIGLIGGSIVFVPLVTILLLVLYSLLLVKPIKRSVESTHEAAAHKHSHLIESLNAIRTIKTLGASSNAQWQWEEATGAIANKSLRSRMLSSSISIVTNTLIQISTVSVVIVGVYAAREQALTLGGLIAVVILSSRAIAPMGQVAALIASYQQARASYGDLDGLMQQPVERPKGKAFINKTQFEGAIGLENVRFVYPGSDWPTLDGLNLKIDAGERVGIIGKAGSGKSTLANLLVQLHQIEAGKITLDGIDLHQVDPHELRRQVAYLSQSAELFQGSIRDNIVFKAPHVDDETMLKAAYLGGVDAFAKSLPMGLDTPVGEQGVFLSGGQKQCVTLARTLLLDTPVVVLDEPTSALDSSTEAVVKQRLNDYVRGKTLVLITHKSSMLDLVDRLIVMDGGRAVMDGPKAQVLKSLAGNAHG